MNAKLYERRHKLLALSHRGMMTVAHMTALAEELDSSANALYVDWNRRERWLPQFVQIEQSRKQLLEMFQEMKMAREALWDIHKAAEAKGKHKTSVGAIKQMMECLHKEVELRQSLGYMAKTPDELVLSVKTERERSREIIDNMTADELKVAMIALEPFKDLVEITT